MSHLYCTWQAGKHVSQNEIESEISDYFSIIHNTSWDVVTKQCWVDTGIPEWFISVLHSLSRKRNIKCTIPQENLDIDASGVLSEKSNHTVVGLAYTTWTGENVQKISKFLLLWITPLSLCHVATLFFFW